MKPRPFPCHDCSSLVRLLKEEQISAVKEVYKGSSACPLAMEEPVLPNTAISNEHKLGGNRAVLVISSLVAHMEDQVYGLKKRSVRASILRSVASVAN